MRRRTSTEHGRYGTPPAGERGTVEGQVVEAEHQIDPGVPLAHGDAQQGGAERRRIVESTLDRSTSGLGGCQVTRFHCGSPQSIATAAATLLRAPRRPPAPPVSNWIVTRWVAI